MRHVDCGKQPLGVSLGEVIINYDPLLLITPLEHIPQSPGTYVFHL